MMREGKVRWEIFPEIYMETILQHWKWLLPSVPKRVKVSVSLSNKGEVEKYFGFCLSCMAVHPPKAKQKKELSTFGN